MDQVLGTQPSGNPRLGDDVVLGQDDVAHQAARFPRAADVRHPGQAGVAVLSGDRRDSSSR